MSPHGESVSLLMQRTDAARRIVSRAPALPNCADGPACHSSQLARSVPKLVSLSVAVLIAQAAQASSPGAPACEALSAPGAFPNTTVSSAKIVAADASKNLPSFCEVTATVKPVAGSNIKVVYRLPESWNGKLLGLGGGGWAGNVLLAYRRVGVLSKGYATAQTNGGMRSATRMARPQCVGHLLVGEPRSGHGLQLPRHPRDDGCGKQVVAEVLRKAASARVLPGMFHRRSAGADGSAALPQGLRRHHRRCARIHADDADDERRA